jgi:hypothetical protein
MTLVIAMYNTQARKPFFNSFLAARLGTRTSEIFRRCCPPNVPEPLLYGSVSVRNFILRVRDFIASVHNFILRVRNFILRGQKQGIILEDYRQVYAQAPVKNAPSIAGKSQAA